MRYFIVNEKKWNIMEKYGKGNKKKGKIGTMEKLKLGW